MNLLPKTKKEFKQRGYWDAFFKKRGKKAFEWYGEYPELAKHLRKYIKRQDAVLITGCGSSTVGVDLHDDGYKNVTNIDISHVVIEQAIASKVAEKRPGLRYMRMDALRMEFGGETFGAVFDKGTLDAMMADDAEETVKEALAYLGEVERVLKAGGRFLCVSLLQEHILRALLDYFPANGWMFRVVRCFDAEEKAKGHGESTLPVFMVVCTKFNKPLPTSVLELNLTDGDKMQRLENTGDVLESIKSVQEAEFICSSLRNATLTDEINFDLYASCNGNPRYTVYVVDVPPERKNSQYAAFIVPQGREAEWLFSTKEGRKNLVRLTSHNRLAIVTMHRGEEYQSLQSVQDELSSTVQNLAPAQLKGEKIQFLSLGSDSGIGKRTVQHRGRSELSGEYVVEDVETEGGEKFRRLYYMDSQLVIQSEAKLKTAKSRRGAAKEALDLTYLTSNHHIYMSVATSLACQEATASPEIAVIGLGGGGLCSFLNKLLPEARITAVDIDADMLKVAKNWFGLQPGEKLHVEIEDGIKFLERNAANGKTWDAILFDVSSKDATVGMSGPPKHFLEAPVLDDVASSLTQSGLFVSNVALRDGALRPAIVASLKAKFPTVASYKLEEDLNEIFVCSTRTCDAEALRSKLQGCCRGLNEFFARQGGNGGTKQSVDVEEFLDGLKINCKS